MTRRTSLAKVSTLILSTQKNLSGWTLIEIGVVTTIIGILATISFPSMVGIKARMETRSYASSVNQALEQAQRNAIKMGKECRVIMDTTSNPHRLLLDPDSKYIGCLQFQELSLNNVKFYENFPGTAIRFSYKGNSTNMGTMIVQSSVSPTVSYCLAMSGMIGVMRKGIYKGNPEQAIDPNQCETGY